MREWRDFEGWSSFFRRTIDPVAGRLRPNNARLLTEHLRIWVENLRLFWWWTTRHTGIDG
jgi:hypothetical protein